MSTATELMDQFLGKRPTPSTQTQLMIVSAGFTLYPTHKVNAQLQVYGVAAPRVCDFPHPPQLVVSKDSVSNMEALRKVSDLKWQETADGTIVFDVAGYDMALSDPTDGPGAAAVAFKMIPRFETLCCGVRLAKAWQKRDFINAWLTFEPGKVFAIPDRYAVDKRKWFDCDHKPIDDFITSWTGYIPDNWNSSRVRCISRAGRQKPGFVIEFNKGCVFMAFGNFTSKDINPLDLGIDIAHIHSMLQLSDIGSATDPPCERVVSFTLGIGSEGPRPPSKPPTSPSQLPKWLSDYLGEDRNEGRPHCGARQMEAPEV